MTTLAKFVKDAKRDLSRFERDWQRKHEEDPLLWPLELPDDDAGRWWELFMVEPSDNA